MMRRILIYRRALLELLCQEVQVYHVVQRRLWNGTLLGHRTLTCTRPKKLQAEKTAEGIV
ncbi:BnaCnng74870D [Brassica napus]|uniref:BnaCnng74870D protein n=1 Tax=Brassica napus TaxID=3708 RepID=A0A078JYV6_BRANA|nr:BnaCnng74870D [Brassica napus]